MKNKLLAAMALSCAASMSVWAGNWEKPTVTFVDPDLTIPTEEIPTTGYRYLENLGEYYIYHVATDQFLTAVNSTQMGLGSTGQLIRLGYGYDRVLYNADTYAYTGWLIQMPNAHSNAQGGAFHELYVAATGLGWVDGFAGHMLWNITKQDDGNYRISVIEEDELFGINGEYGETCMARVPSSEDDATNIVLPVVNLLGNGNELAQPDWKFVSVDSYETYAARIPLYDLLNQVEEGGMTDLDAFVDIYNNASSTKEELEQAVVDLKDAYAQFIIKDASLDNPVDLTSYITDADCNVIDGWTLSGDANLRRNSGEHWSNDASVGYLDSNNWNGTSWSGSARQTLSLPDGLYKLTAAGRGAETASITLVAGNYSVDFPMNGSVGGTIATDGTEWASVEEGIAAGKTFARAEGTGYGWNYVSLDFTVDGEEVALGIDVKGTAAYSWVSAGNFKLTYYGPVSTEQEKELLSQAIEAAKATLQGYEDNNNNYSLAGKDSVDADLAAAEAVLANEAATAEEIGAAAKTLNSRMATFAYDVEVYSKMPAKLDELNAIWDRFGANPPAFEELGVYVDELYDAYEARTFEPADFAGIDAKADELYLKGIQIAIVSGELTDVTLLITNPDFSNGATGWNGSPEIEYQVAQKWSGSPINFDVYQEITGLPEGSYKITVDGFFRPGGYANCGTNYRPEGDAYNAITSYVYANGAQTPLMHLFDGLLDEQPEDVTDFVQMVIPNAPELDGKWGPNMRVAANYAINTAGKYKENSVIGAVGEDGVLRFGVKGASVNGDSWTVFDNFTITYMGEDLTGYQNMLQVAIDKALTVINSVEVKANEDVAALEGLRVMIIDAFDSYGKEELIAQTAALNAAIEVVEEGITIIKNIYEQAMVYSLSADNGEFDGYDDLLVYELEYACEDIILSYSDENFQTIEEAKTLQTEMYKAYSAMVMGGVEGSLDNPVDVTALLNCPSFEDNAGTASSNGWIVNVAGGNTGCTDTGAGKNYEVYNTTYDVYQLIYSVPAGWYKLQAQGFYRAGGDGATPVLIARRDSVPEDNAVLYAMNADGSNYIESHLCSIFDGVLFMGDEGTASSDVLIAEEYRTESDIEMGGNLPCLPNMPDGATSRFNIGLYMNEVIFYVNEGTEYIQVGVKKDKELACDWTIFDNFRLTWYGDGERPDAIETVEGAAASVVNSVYYTIGGVRIDKPAQRGLYIREDLLNDGTKKVTKVLVK